MLEVNKKILVYTKKNLKNVLTYILVYANIILTDIKKVPVRQLKRVSVHSLDN